MKAFLLLIFVCGVFAQTPDNVCYNDLRRACEPNSGKIAPSVNLLNCNATYGAITEVVGDLQKYANSHIFKSFDFLLMSTHYANYEKSRAGFEKLFRELSDTAWNDAITLIKHITKRGGEMNFKHFNPDDAKPDSFELNEIESIARALDIEKKLAEGAHAIHAEATRRKENYHDPEISAFLEEEFVHRHANTIRKLSGHITDLKSMLSGGDSSLALYLFDEYLQK